MEKSETENNKRLRRGVVAAVVSGTVVAGHKYWLKPVVNTVLLPAHAQTSAPASEMIVPRASASASVGGSIDMVIQNAVANESVKVTANLNNKSATLSAKANKKGIAQVRFSRAKLLSSGFRDLRSGDIIAIKAVSDSGRIVKTAIKVTQGKQKLLVVTLQGDAETNSASIVVKNANSGEPLVATVVASGRNVVLKAKANSAGATTIPVSSNAFKKASIKLKKGQKIYTSVSGTSSGKGKAATIVAGREIVKPLAVAIQANADTNSAKVTITDAKPGENVSARLTIESRSVPISGKADAKGIVSLDVSSAALKSAGIVLKKGQNATVTATAASGAKGSSVATVTGRDIVTPLAVSISANSDTNSAKIVVANAKSGENVAVKLSVDGRSVTLSGKANEKGAVSIDASAAALKSAGIVLKRGQAVKADAVAASGAKGTATGVVTGREVITPLAVSVTASADTNSAKIAVANAKPGESVAMKFTVDGRTATISGKANEKGALSGDVSSAALKAAGIVLKPRQVVTAQATAASGARGSATGAVTGRVATPLLASITADADTNTASVSVRSAVPGETVSVSVSVDGKTVALKTKADAKGVATVTATADAMKRAGIALKAGQTVRADATAASGAKGSASTIAKGTPFSISSVTADTASGISMQFNGVKATDVIALEVAAGGKSLAYKFKGSDRGTVKADVSIASLKELSLKAGSIVTLSARLSSGLIAKQSVTMTSSSITRPVITPPIIKPTVKPTIKPITKPATTR